MESGLWTLRSHTETDHTGRVCVALGAMSAEDDGDGVPVTPRTDEAVVSEAERLKNEGNKLFAGARLLRARSAHGAEIGGTGCTLHSQGGMRPICL